MNTIIGLIIIAIGSLGQSSSYVPINKVKNWSWESFWLVQGIFAWLIFPLVGAMIALPSGTSLFEVWSAAGAGAWKSIGYGVFWGVGGLTFGLSMRYLGVALGQSLALGTCSAFGTLIPALLKGENLFTGNGLILLIGVSIAIAGIAVIGYAGALKSRNMSEEEKKKAVKDFALKKGILIALLAGVMSACFNLGLDAGSPIKAYLVQAGASELLVLNPVILLVTIGGFITNASYCLFQNSKNKTFKDYTTTPGGIWGNNLIFCALAGLLWYSQFFGLGIGQSFFEPESVMMAFSWSILMSLNVLFSNMWGIILKEWKGAGRTTIVVLVCGLGILILSIIFPHLVNSKKPQKAYDVASFTEIETNFVDIPSSVQTSVYWYWISDNISKKGVIKDLESMKKVGINRAFIGNIGLPTSDQPYGNVKLLSDEWWDITMRYLSLSELSVKGPQTLSVKLERPDENFPA